MPRSAFTTIVLFFKRKTLAHTTHTHKKIHTQLATKLSGSFVDNKCVYH